MSTEMFDFFKMGRYEILAPEQNLYNRAHAPCHSGLILFLCNYILLTCEGWSKSSVTDAIKSRKISVKC